MIRNTRYKLQPAIATNKHLWNCPYCGIPFKGRRQDFNHHAVNHHYAQYATDYLKFKQVERRCP